ncbi:MAG TPA: 16S rRNA (guanine(966)-N(2))-methyltransferase RsmD [Pyrinomonadaceae bacterium]|jgi:16S rRNA (guanine(966)-N(2))-methyltransferase RsmD|nr:16S rRNA (guanine(966)-N(2))-methyltransferase RsmD [Pyrinomonadaceae bacterium]
MRIITGKHRGRKLKSPPSLATRPTSDRLRETLFNILAPRIEGARFLDLCAGTGAVGIEALSRGALHVTFVDQSRRMCALIEVNLRSLKIDEAEFKVVCADAVEFLRHFGKREAPGFDIIFFDPPYATNYDNVTNYIGRHAESLLADDGICVVEHFRKVDLPDDYFELTRYRALKQGDSCLSFYARR